MARVFIFGAGSSKAIYPSAPLNDELLPGALNLGKGPIAARMKLVNAFIKDFYGLPKSRPPALENLLSQLDLAINERRPLSSQYSLPKLRELRESLVFGMAELLRVRLQKDRNPVDLYDFWKSFQKGDCAVSLNYDIILDNSLLGMQGPADYGIGVRYGLYKYAPSWRGNRYVWRGDRYVPSSNIPLFKPHGSLNWVYCPICAKLDVTTQVKVVAFLFADDQLRCFECGGRFEALIIPPTLFKSYGNGLLLDIWRNVETKLSSADEIIFVGYSLPDADIQLRCLLSRSVFRNRARRNQSSRRGPIIRVIGWEGERSRPGAYDERKPSDTHQRYLKLFDKVDYDPMGFEGYINRGCKTFKQSTSG